MRIQRRHSELRFAATSCATKFPVCTTPNWAHKPERNTATTKKTTTKKTCFCAGNQTAKAAERCRRTAATPNRTEPGLECTCTHRKRTLRRSRKLHIQRSHSPLPPLLQLASTAAGSSLTSAGLGAPNGKNTRKRRSGGVETVREAGATSEPLIAHNDWN